MADLPGNVAFGEAHAHGRRDFHGVNFARVADERRQVDIESRPAVLARLLLDAQQAAGNGVGTAADLQVRAAQRGVELRHICFFVEWEPKHPEPLAQGRLRVVIHARDYRPPLRSSTVSDCSTSLSWLLVKSTSTV